MEEWINSSGKIAGSISAILAIAKRKAEQKQRAEFQKTVLAKLDAITDDIADLQYERLSQAHDFYTTRGWCPTSKKAQLCNMYKSYTGKGRNHLSAHYEQEILALDDNPPA